jgi:hypothetical protein
MKMINKPASSIHVTSEALFLKSDRWLFSELGYADDELPAGQKAISFYALEQEWLKVLMKELVWRKRNSVQAYTLIAYTRVGRGLSKYISDESSIKTKSCLNQGLIRGYLESIRGKAYATRTATYAQLNEMTTSWIQWGLISKNLYPLVVKDMIPRKTIKSTPKGLSFKVQRQLEDYIKRDDCQESRMLSVIMETGMRGGRAGSNEEK